MPVELDDQQYATLQKLAAFTQELATSPKTRRQFERIAKELRPELETTDDIAAEAAKPYVEQLEKTNARLDEFLTAQQEREARAAESQADRERDEAFARLRQAGFTEDLGIPAIKQLMIDRKIADPEAAAALYEKMNPPVETGPSAWEPDTFDIRNNAVGNDVEGLFQNEDAWADKEAARTLNEFRQAARAA